jgi:hypothetical protein
MSGKQQIDKIGTEEKEKYQVDRNMTQLDEAEREKMRSGGIFSPI